MNGKSRASLRVCQRFGPSGELGMRAEAEVENFLQLVLRTLLHEAHAQGPTAEL